MLFWEGGSPQEVRFQSEFKHTDYKEHNRKWVKQKTDEKSKDVANFLPQMWHDQQAGNNYNHVYVYQTPFMMRSC